MCYSPYNPDTQPDAGAAAPLEVPEGGEVSVRTADEFLAAIGSNRTIVIDTGLLDLSTASDYGVLGGEHYFWQDWYDGPELVIRDVQNLSIRAAADDPAACTVTAVPRYANVLAFLDCTGIRVSGLTAGHTEGKVSQFLQFLKSVLVDVKVLQFFQTDRRLKIYILDLFKCGNKISYAAIQNCQFFFSK